MTANEGKPRKRKIETRVTDQIGERIDRLAKEYRTKQVPGANITASDAVRAVVHVGLAAEEKRLGLKPLPEEPTPPEQAETRRPGRRKKGTRVDER
jgi:hypothetical protein